MDIVFIHGNYPAQFRHILGALDYKGGSHRIFFLTYREVSQEEVIQGVEVIRMKRHREGSEAIHHYLRETEISVLNGQAVIRALSELVERGVKPGVVIAHGGLGYLLYIRDLLRDVRLIGYFEWYFRSETSKYLIEEDGIDVDMLVRTRNLVTLQEMVECQTTVIPTTWQKSQFPKQFQQDARVVFDGIDREYFRTPTKQEEKGDITLKNRETGESFHIRQENRVLTYSTRGMEPVRGFPEFLRALPRLLREKEDLMVVIAGKDRSAYGVAPKNKSGSWKKYMLDELGEFEGRERIVWTGLLDYSDYREMLWRSDAHVYLTRPFVTSWGLFEAASCGCKMIVSRGEATRFVVEDDSVRWVDMDSQTELERGINEVLDGVFDKRAVLRDGFEIREALKEWERILQGNDSR